MTTDSGDCTAGEVDLTALAWIKDVVGENLTAYIMACEVDSLSELISGEMSLVGQQFVVVQEFMALRHQVDDQFANLPASTVVGAVLAQFGDDGRAVARSLRLRVTGSEVIPAGEDDIERALVTLALDSYAAFLLPPDPELPAMMHIHTPIAVVRLVHHHPQSKVFFDAVLRDPVFKKVFVEENEHAGFTALVYRNVGSGGGLQLIMLPDLILNAARRQLGDDSNPEAFAAAAVEQLRLMRDVLARKPRTISAKIAFTGVLLPTGASFDIGKHSVRAVTEGDRGYAPESLKAQLAGTDQSGVSTVVNYDGDLLLDFKFPLRVKVMPSSQDFTSEWPQDMMPPDEMMQTAIRLRFSLMLAVDREVRIQLVQTWIHYDDPFGYSLSWNDPRQGTGIMPVQLTDAEVTAWQEWYARLDAAPVRKIDLALTRVMRAIAERREPSDVLIDSVIAWENIFGTKDGEPTFRITMCIAKLLEDSVEERLALKSKLGKIYTLRSDIVHGNRNLEREEYLQCQEALDIAIRVVKVLVAERTDIMSLPDGARRSARLLLDT